MLQQIGQSFDGQRVVVSGSGNVAIYAAQKAEQLGAKGHLSSGAVIFDGVRDKVYQQLLDAQLVREDVQASLKGRQSESQPLPRRLPTVPALRYACPADWPR